MEKPWGYVRYTNIRCKLYPDQPYLGFFFLKRLVLLQMVGYSMYIILAVLQLFL